MSDKAVVHVIDDDDALRDSIGFLLASAGIEVRAYESADSYLETTPLPTSGCIVTDLRMPGKGGMELLRAVKETSPTLPVIVITGHGDIPLAVEAMRLGALDFIEKPFDDEALLGSVRRALEQGEKNFKKDADRTGTQAKLALLSPREREVLAGLVAGKANKIIAHDLNISPRTVEIYRANVMTKMEANSLSDLVRMTLLADVPITDNQS